MQTVREKLVDSFVGTIQYFPPEMRPANFELILKRGFEKFGLRLKRIDDVYFAMSPYGFLIRLYKNNLFNEMKENAGEVSVETLKTNFQNVLHEIVKGHVGNFDVVFGNLNEVSPESCAEILREFFAENPDIDCNVARRDFNGQEYYEFILQHKYYFVVHSLHDIREVSSELVILQDTDAVTFLDVMTYDYAEILQQLLIETM